MPRWLAANDDNDNGGCDGFGRMNESTDERKQELRSTTGITADPRTLLFSMISKGVTSSCSKMTRKTGERERRRTEMELKIDEPTDDGNEPKLKAWHETRPIRYD